MAAPTDTRAREGTETRAVERTGVVEREGWTPTFGPGLILGGLAAVGVIISLFVEWTSGGPKPDGFPVAFLGDDATSSTSPPCARCGGRSTGSTSLPWDRPSTASCGTTSAIGTSRS